MNKLLKKIVMLGIATTMTFGGVNNTCYAMEKADTGVKVEDTTDSIGPVYNKSGKVGTMYSDNIRVNVTAFFNECVGGVGLVANDYCELSIENGNAQDYSGAPHYFSAHGDNVTTCSASGTNRVGSWGITKIMADVSVCSDRSQTQKHMEIKAVLDSIVVEKFQ